LTNCYEQVRSIGQVLIKNPGGTDDFGDNLRKAALIYSGVPPHSKALDRLDELFEKLASQKCHLEGSNTRDYDVNSGWNVSTEDEVSPVAAIKPGWARFNRETALYHMLYLYGLERHMVPCAPVIIENAVVSRSTVTTKPLVQESSDDVFSFEQESSDAATTVTGFTALSVKRNKLFEPVATELFSGTQQVFHPQPRTKDIEELIDSKATQPAPYLQGPVEGDIIGVIQPYLTSTERLNHDLPIPPEISLVISTILTGLGDAKRGGIIGPNRTVVDGEKMNPGYNFPTQGQLEEVNGDPTQILAPLSVDYLLQKDPYLGYPLADYRVTKPGAVYEYVKGLKARLPKVEEFLRKCPILFADKDVERLSRAKKEAGDFHGVYQDASRTHYSIDPISKQNDDLYPPRDPSKDTLFNKDQIRAHRERFDRLLEFCKANRKQPYTLKDLEAYVSREDGLDLTARDLSISAKNLTGRLALLINDPSWISKDAAPVSLPEEDSSYILNRLDNPTCRVDQIVRQIKKQRSGLPYWLAADGNDLPAEYLTNPHADRDELREWAFNPSIPDALIQKGDEKRKKAAQAESDRQARSFKRIGKHLAPIPMPSLLRGDPIPLVGAGLSPRMAGMPLVEDDLLPPAAELKSLPPVRSEDDLSELNLAPPSVAEDRRSSDGITTSGSPGTPHTPITPRARSRSIMSPHAHSRNHTPTHTGIHTPTKGIRRITTPATATTPTD